MKVWAKTAEFSEGKFMVVRRDGSVPHWPHFVMGARDPFVPAALRAYADAARREPGIDPEYIDSIFELANDYERYRATQGNGDPDHPPHRKDHGDVLAVMRGEPGLVYLVPDKGNVTKGK